MQIASLLLSYEIAYIATLLLHEITIFTICIIVEQSKITIVQFHVQGKLATSMTAPSVL